jgi:catechol 2,3-dioxygenase-like lactoylglutathione lyase family enzyme
MTAARAFNHVGMTVPDIDRAIDWYSAVLGFRLIYRRTLEHRPAVPEVREIFGPRFGRAHQAHLLGANGVGLVLFQFLDPPVVDPPVNFRYYETGIFHLCVTGVLLLSMPTIGSAKIFKLTYNQLKQTF